MYSHICLSLYRADYFLFHKNKNKYLDAIIKEYCEKHPRTLYDEVWSSIISNDGSVQHLTQLTDVQKSIYKTSMEIDQRWLIEHAADRQIYVFDLINEILN